MVQIKLVLTGSTKTILVEETKTINSILSDAKVNTNSVIVYLQGSPLSREELNSTPKSIFPEANTFTLSSVVKTESN